MIVAALVLLPALAGCWLVAIGAVWGKRSSGVREHATAVELLAVCGCIGSASALIAASWNDLYWSSRVSLAGGQQLVADAPTTWWLLVPTLLLLATAWQWFDNGEEGEWADPIRRGLRLLLLATTHMVTLASDPLTVCVALIGCSLLAATLVGDRDGSLSLRLFLPADLGLGYAGVLVLSLAAGAVDSWITDGTAIRLALTSSSVPGWLDRWILWWLLAAALLWRAGLIPISGWWPAQAGSMLSNDGVTAAGRADRLLVSLLMPLLSLILVSRLVGLQFVAATDLWPPSSWLAHPGRWLILFLGIGTCAATLVAAYESRSMYRLTALHASTIGVGLLTVVLGLHPGQSRPALEPLLIAAVYAGVSVLVCLGIGLIRRGSSSPNVVLFDEGPPWWSIGLLLALALPVFWPAGGLMSVFGCWGVTGLTWLTAVIATQAYTVLRLTAPATSGEASLAATEAKVRAAGGRLPVRLLWTEATSQEPSKVGRGPA